MAGGTDCLAEQAIHSDVITGVNGKSCIQQEDSFYQQTGLKFDE